jgi:hypothetical protein
MRRWFVTLSIGVVAVSACSSSSGSLSSYQQSLLPGFEASLTKTDLGGVEPTAAQRKCTATGVIAAIGDKDLQALGFTAANAKAKVTASPKLNPADAVKAAAAYSKCLDLRAVLERGFASGISGIKLTPKEVSCLFTGATEADFRDEMVSSFEGTSAGSPLEKQFQSRLTTCVSKGELQKISQLGGG